MTGRESLFSFVRRALRWAVCDSNFRWWTSGCATGIFIGLALGRIH